MDIEIPSPSVFLKRSPEIQSAPPLRTKKPQRSRGSNASRAANAALGEGIQNLNESATKPKQTKSRNGCKVCKQKRLKCDETQPTCLQCQKRGVDCLGYEKNYKWKQQDQTDFNAKPGLKTKPKTRFEYSENAQVGHADEGLGFPSSDLDHHSSLEAPLSPGLQSAFVSAAYAIRGLPPIPDSSATVQQLTPRTRYGLPNQGRAEDLVDRLLPDHLEIVEPGSLSSTTTYTHDWESSRSPTGSFSSESHSLPDFIMPDADMDIFLPQSNSDLSFVPVFDDLPTSPSTPHVHSISRNKLDAEEVFDEEIPRDTLPELNMTVLDFSPPQIPHSEPANEDSDTASTSSKTSNVTIVARPSLQADTYDMLVAQFAHRTSGILSVKNGENENPWRNLVWPLLRDSKALQHAIWSMTAFHSVYDDPSFHTLGVQQVGSSIRALNAELHTGQNRLETSLATCLALAFSEGWDSSASTGITHLHGARALVNNGIQQLRTRDRVGSLYPQDPVTFKFLCNTYIYMEVIAHLTSASQTPDLDLEDILHVTNMPQNLPVTGMFRGQYHEIDPLMGCAVTLFPLIGRVAKLIQKVRQTEKNRPRIISQAAQLKQQLEQWQVPNANAFRTPEDMHSQVLDSIQTAEAYRLATLLYLHQAVPEIPSDPAIVLAEQILSILATVPDTSNACIVQIFPLFIASCEITNEEDRAWVEHRWSAMIQRLRIRNVTACWEVIHEVWCRRARYEQEMANRVQRNFPAGATHFGNFPPPLFMEGGEIDTGGSLVQAHHMGTGTNHTRQDFDNDDRTRTRRMTFDCSMPTQPQRTPSTMFTVPSLMRRSTDPHFSQSNPEYTIRGSLHWLKVMTDLGWEVFLG